MQKGVKKFLAKAIAATMALSIISAVPADAKAKKPSLSKTKVTITKGKTVKVTVKNAKPKKTTWKVTKGAKVVKLTKKTKSYVKIKGLKAGSATIKAAIKVGKKTTNKTLKVTVKDASKNNNSNATTAPSNSTDKPNATTEPSKPAATPEPTPVATREPLIKYNEGFEGEDGKGSVGRWVARRSDEEGKGVNCTVTTTDKAEDVHSGKYALLVTGRETAWNGATISDLNEDITYGGAKYKFTLYCKVPAGEKFGSSDKTKVKVRVSTGYKLLEEDSDDDKHYSNWPRDFDNEVYNNEWTEISGEFTTPAVGCFYEFYFETNGSGKAPLLIDDVSIERISAPRDYDPTLPSLKEAYEGTFNEMGAAVTYDDLLNKNTLGWIKHHYNSVTLGNQFKLDSVINADEPVKYEEAENKNDFVLSDAYKAAADNKDAEGNLLIPKIDFSVLDKVMKICKENGIKLRIHSPFWHQQNPGIFFTKGYKKIDTKKDENNKDNVKPEDYTDKDTMYTREDMYVKTLLNHICNSEYGDCVYAYDVVNEYVHMDNEGVYINHWKYVFGDKMETNSQFVKQAFVSAYEELEAKKRVGTISLIYNDYSTYMGSTADKICELINFINAKDDMNKEGKKICDGIGMQSHIGEKEVDKALYYNTIDKFRQNDFEIQITELDVTNCGQVTSESDASTKEKVWNLSAEKYKELFEALVEQKKLGANITSVTIWGTVDAKSWRPDNAPVLFGEDLADVKPAFNAIIEVAKNAK